LTNEEIINVLKNLPKIGDYSHDPTYKCEERQEIYQGKLVEGIRKGFGACYSF
jgi:hypothetical protein